MTPLTDIQQTRIVNNVIAACRDITKLNKTGYDFLYLASGFIAHYNRAGFIGHYYGKPGSLQADIEANARQNQWHNFRAGEQHADYYHSKRDTYNAILGRLCAAEYFKRHGVAA